VGEGMNMGNGILLGSRRRTDVCLLHGALAGWISKELLRGRYARMRIVELTHQFLDGQRKVDLPSLSYSHRNSHQAYQVKEKKN
jgi:hypothetical protein